VLSSAGTLHVGDEIQDINGCSVDGQSLDSLQSLLVCFFTPRLNS